MRKRGSRHVGGGLWGISCGARATRFEAGKKSGDRALLLREKDAGTKTGLDENYYDLQSQTDQQGAQLGKEKMHRALAVRKEAYTGQLSGLSHFTRRSERRR